MFIYPPHYIAILYKDGDVMQTKITNQGLKYFKKRFKRMFRCESSPMIKMLSFKIGIGLLLISMVAASYYLKKYRKNLKAKHKAMRMLKMNNIKKRQQNKEVNTLSSVAETESCNSTMNDKTIISLPKNVDQIKYNSKQSKKNVMERLNKTHSKIMESKFKLMDSALKKSILVNATQLMNVPTNEGAKTTLMNSQVSIKKSSKKLQQQQQQQRQQSNNEQQQQSQEMIQKSNEQQRKSKEQQQQSKVLQRQSKEQQRKSKEQQQQTNLIQQQSKEKLKSK